MGELLKLNSVKSMDYLGQKVDFCNFGTELQQYCGSNMPV